MKLGLMTACLPGPPLEKVADWVAAQGFQSLEAAAWPGSDDRPFTATHIAAEPPDDAAAAGPRAMFTDRGLTLSSLAFYENNLHHDPDHSWWRFRVPGLGDVDWRKIIDVLYEHESDGTVSVEREDPLCGGTEERTKTGRAIAYRTLSSLLAD